MWGLSLPSPFCEFQGWNSTPWACTENRLSTELSYGTQDVILYIKIQQEYQFFYIQISFHL